MLHPFGPMMCLTLEPKDIESSLGSVTVPNGVDQITIEHWSVTQDCNSPNSVVPTSVCISATAKTLVLILTALAQSNPPI
ncbi:MAG: hypothetical protein IPL08_06610 [Saprospiraceae bacterium]|nr:hypothetical protein [Saprospiraceae bacterium]